MIRIDGAQGAIFIDRQGEAIASYTAFADEGIKLMGAHYGIVWAEVEDLIVRFFQTTPKELMLSLERAICFIKAIQSDYLIFLILKPTGNLGQVRRWIRWASEEILKEI